MSTAPRVIVLWCPDWPIVALRSQEPRIPASAPIAVIADGAVVAVSSAGRAAGVRRGLRRREAQSRCPAIVLRPADPERDARAAEPIVAALERVVPGVAVLRPGLIAIRAAGPAAYYGAERAAAEALVGRVAELGVTAVAGIADGVFTAELAARRLVVEGSAAGAAAGRHPSGAGVATVPPGGSPAFLAPLPVDVLGDEALAGLLVRLGIRTLGGFAALQAADVLDRFGPSGCALHRRAAGLDDRAAEPRVPPPELTVAVAFEPPLELAEQVAFAIRADAERFVEAHTRRRLACTGLRVTAVDADGGVLERVWLHPGAFSPADVTDRVRWQLGGATAPERVAGDRLRSGIVEVRLAPESIDPIGVHEPGLWGGGPDERVHRVLARLQSLLGHGAVLRPALAGGRDPRDRQRVVPWGDRGPAQAAVDAPWPGRLPSPSPGSVFPEPHPVLVVDGRGAEVVVSRRGLVSGEPAQLRVADRTLPIAAWAGPWPVLRHDDADGPRWRVQAVDGDGCGWLLASAADGWWAEARYD